MAIEQPLPIGRTTEIDVNWNWAPWLTDVGDQVASYTLAPSAGLLFFDDSEAGGVVTTWVKLDPAAGPPNVGAELVISCRVVTDSTPPRKDTREIRLLVVRAP